MPEPTLAEGSSCCNCACLAWDAVPARSSFRGNGCFGGTSHVRGRRVLSSCDKAVVVWRVLAGVYFLLARTITGSIKNDGLWFFGFLTNWGVLVTGITLLLNGAVGLLDWCGADASSAAVVEGEEAAGATASAGGSPARSESASYTDLRRTALCCGELWWGLEFLITVVFWALLYDPSNDRGPVGEYSNINIHALCFVAASIDRVVGGMPVLLSHITVVTLTTVVYVTTNAVWTVSAGEAFYSILPWHDNAGLAAGVSAGTAVAAHLAYVLDWALVNYVRNQACGRCSGSVTDRDRLQKDSSTAAEV